MQSKDRIKKLTLSSLLLAVGLILPFFTGQIPVVGGMLLPMHIPVLLCGLICGWQYGALIGIIMPLMRLALFGMPPLLSAIPMSFELMAYGATAGYLYGRSRWQCIIALYRSLLAAMVAGRAIWGVVKVLMTGVAGQAFTWKMFMTASILNAIPGIILQFILIPVVMLALDRTGLVKFHREESALRHLKA